MLHHVYARETIRGAVLSARPFRRQERAIVIAPRPLASSRDRDPLEGPLCQQSARWGGPPATTRLGLDDRPIPRMSFDPNECNPFKLFNLFGLGHWSQFSWARLLEHSRS